MNFSANFYNSATNSQLSTYRQSLIITFSDHFLMFFPFRILYFEERNLIKIFKTYIDDKIYPC